MNGRERAGLLLALMTATVSGVAIFLNGYGVRAVKDATVYTTGKNTVSAVLLLALVAASSLRGRRVLTRPATWRQGLGLAAVGVIGGSVPFVLFFEGLLRESSTNAAFLQKTLVVWVCLLAVPLLGESVGWLQVAAIALLLLGQAMVGSSVSSVTSMPFGTGEALVLAATLLWAIEVVLARRLLGSLTSWTVGVVRMALGSTLLLAWLGIRGRFGALVSLDAGQWGWVLLTGVVLAVYVATWFAALARARAIDVTAVLVIGAPITAALTAVVQHAPLRPQLGGLGLIALGGAVILVSRLWKPRAAIAS